MYQRITPPCLRPRSARDLICSLVLQYPNDRCLVSFSRIVPLFPVDVNNQINNHQTFLHLYFSLVSCRAQLSSRLLTLSILSPAHPRFFRLIRHCIAFTCKYKFLPGSTVPCKSEQPTHLNLLWRRDSQDTAPQKPRPLNYIKSYPTWFLIYIQTTSQPCLACRIQPYHNSLKPRPSDDLRIHAIDILNEQHLSIPPTSTYSTP